MGFCNGVDDVHSSSANSSRFIFIEKPNTPTTETTTDNVLTAPYPKQIRSISQDSGYGCRQSTSDDEHFDTSSNSQTIPLTPTQEESDFLTINNELMVKQNIFNNSITLNEKLSQLIIDRENEVLKRREENEKHEIELVGRISEWYAHLAPILRAARERSFFDIHAYGREIVQTFSSTQNKTSETDNSHNGDEEIISFSKILENRPKDLTARYFLSVLQLANTENIQIIPPTNRSRFHLSDTNELKIKLLNQHIQLEAMDESLSFECCEPAAKKRKLDVTTQVSVNPINQIIQKCSIPQKKDEKIEKIIEQCKVNQEFVDVCRSYSANQLLSMIGKIKNSSTSEFGDSGFESLNSSILSNTSLVEEIF